MRKKSSAISLYLLVAGILLLPSINSQITQTQNFGNLYLGVNETIAWDLSEYFEGTSLSFEATGPATVTPKFTANQGTVGYNFTSFSFPHNAFGLWNLEGPLSMLDADNNLYWATISGSDGVPNIIGHLSLTNDPTINCVATKLYGDGIVVADCIQNNTGNNILFIVNTTSASIITNTTTPWEVYSTSSTPRRWLFLTNSGETYYVLRAFPASSLGTQANNSYVEILTISNLTAGASLFRIIDRAALGIPTLNLVGFDNVGLNLFLIDWMGTAYQISNWLNAEEDLVIYTISVPSQLYSAALCSFDFGLPGTELFIASTSAVYAIDWNIPSSPVIIEKYSLQPSLFDQIVQVDQSQKYLYVMGTNTQNVATLLVLSKTQKFFNAVFYIKSLLYVESVVWNLNRDTDNLLIYQANNTFANYHFGRSILTLSNIQSPTQDTFNLTATDFLNNTQTVTLTYYAVSDSDANTYYTGANNVSQFSYLYPSTISQSLSGYVAGPAITVPYASQGNYTVNEILTFSQDINANYTNTYFSKFQKHLGAPDQYFLFTQIDNYLLIFQICQYQPTIQSLICEQAFNLSLTGPIQAIGLGLLHIEISLKNSSNLLQYDFDGTLVSNTTLPGGCNSITVSYNTFTQFAFCANQVYNTIIAETSSGTIVDINSSIAGINPAFSPLQVIADPNYPSFLFVLSPDGIYIINIYNTASDTFYVENFIALSPSITKNNQTSFAVSGTSLIVVSQAAGLIQEIDISDIKAPFFRKSYSNFFFQPNATLISNSLSASSVSSNFMLSIIDSNNNINLTAYTSGLGGNANLLLNFASGSQSASGAFITSDYESENGDIFIVTIGNSTTAIYLNSEPQWEIQTSIAEPADVYESNNNTVQFQSVYDTGMDYQNVTFNITILNTQYSIQVFDQSSPILTQLNGTTAGKVLSVDNGDFFVGITNNFTLETSDGADVENITLIPKVTLNSTFVDVPTWQFLGSDVGANYAYLQTSNSLLRYSDQTLHDITALSFQYIDYNTEICNRLAVDSGELYSVSTCYDPSASQYYLVIVSYLSSSPSISIVINTTITQVNQIKLSNNWLFVLEGNSTDFLSSESRIHVYQLALGTGNPYNYYGFLDGSVFNVDEILISGFDVYALSYGNLRLFLADAQFGIRTADWNILGFTWENITSTNIAQSNAFYGAMLSPSVIWSGVASTYGVNDFYHELVLISQNYNSYYLSWVLGLNGNNAILEPLKAFVGYNIGSATNKYRVLNNTNANDGMLAITVQTPNSFVEVIYSIANASNGRNISNLTHEGAIAAVPYYTAIYDADPTLLWLDAEENFKIWVPVFGQQAGIINEYDLRSNLTINVTGELESWWLTLTASNEFSAASVQFNLGNVPVVPSSVIPGASEVIEYITPNIESLQLSLTQGETRQINLNEFILGYNATYQLSGVPFTNIQLNGQQFSHLGWTIVAADAPKDSQGSFDLTRNTVIIDDTNTLWWTSLTSVDALPNLTYTNNVQFESDLSIICYDVKSLPGSIAVIDCYSPDEGEDIFYFVNLVNSGVSSTSFPTLAPVITPTNYKTRLLKYSTFGSVSYLYRVQTVYGFGGSLASEQLSYVQIWIYSNANVQYFTVYDFAKLSSPSGLYITDADVYNGDIFLADVRGYIYRITNYTTYAGLANFTYAVIPDAVYAVKVLPEVSSGQVTITTLVGGRNTIYEVTWDDFYSPSVGVSYVVSPFQVNITSLDASINFVYVLTQNYNNEQGLLQVYSRAAGISQNASTVYTVYESTPLGPNTLFTLSRSTDNILILSESIFENINYSPIYINITASTTGASSVPVQVVLPNLTETLTIQINTISSDNYSIQTNTTTQPPLSLTIAQNLNIGLGQSFNGPLLTFLPPLVSSSASASEDFALPVTDSVPVIETTQLLTTNYSFSYTSIYFNYIEAYPGVPNHLFMFTQIDNQTLVEQICFYSNVEVYWTCEYKGNVTYTDNVTNLAIGGIEFVALTLSSSSNIIQYYDINLNPLGSQTVSSGCSNLEYSATDISNPVLYCTEPTKNSIVVFSASGLPSSTGFSVLATWTPTTPLISSNVQNFAPLAVYTSAFYPSLVFIQTSTGAIILNANNQNSVSFVSEITVDINGADLIISNGYLIFYSYANNTIQEWDFSNIYQPYLHKSYPQYSGPDLSSYNILAQPFTGSGSSTTNNFYISTIAQPNLQNDILVFTAGASGNANLYALFNFSTSTPALVTSDSANSQIDILSITQNNTLYFYAIYNEPYLSYNFSIGNSTDAVVTQTLVVSAYSQLVGTSSTQNITYTFTAFNYALPVTALSASSQATNGFTSVDLSKPLTVVVDDSLLFNGTITSFYLATQFSQDQAAFSLIQHVSLTSSSSPVGQATIYDIYQGPTNTYYLTNTTLFILASSSVSNVSISLSQFGATSQTCLRMAPLSANNLSFIAVACQDQSNQVYLALVQINGTTGTLVSLQSTILSAVNLLQSNNGDLWILESDILTAPTSSYSKIHYFTYYSLSNSLSYITSLTGTQLGINNLQIGGFEILPLGGSNYQIIFTNALVGLYSVQYVNSTFSGPQSINLASNTAFNTSYLPADVEWYGVYLLNSTSTSSVNSNTSSLNLIITTANYHAYQVSWNTASSNLTLIQTYLSYNGSSMTNNIEQQGNYVFIAANSATGESNVLIYTLTGPNYVFGLIEYATDSLLTYVLEAFVNTTNNNVVSVLSACGGGCISINDIRPNLTIQYTPISSQPVTSTYLALTASNAYTDQTVHLTISSIAKNSGNSSSDWWWITLIVVGSVLLLGGIIFALYKLKKKRDEDSSKGPLLIVDSDGSEVKEP